MGAAETLEPGAMRTLTQATRLRLDPDGVLADDNHAHERRWFECEQTYGGVFVLRGELDAEGGALVKTAIDALSHGMALARPGRRRSAVPTRWSTWPPRSCAAVTTATCTGSGPISRSR